MLEIDIRTSRDAEKMEFMTGMYEFDVSGEIERVSMRGSGRFRSLQGS